MGYPNFGKVKTVVLPIPIEEMSVEEYKEKYGIDLSEFLTLDATNGRISLDANSLVLLQDIDGALYINGSTGDGFSTRGALYPVASVSQVAYEADSVDGRLTIGSINQVENAIFGISFRIPASREFEMDNVFITAAVN